jgi:hypothetical protein
MTLRLKSSAPHHIIVEPWTSADYGTPEDRAAASNPAIISRINTDVEALYHFICTYMPVRFRRELAGYLGIRP